MNAFSRFGIKHLSASSLNLWREAPGLWAVQYIAGVRDDGSPGAWRGSAVEAGMHYQLRGREGGLEAALQNFDANCQGEISEAIDTERALIEPMLKQCAKWDYKAELTAHQLRIEHHFEGIPIPLTGFCDFIFDDGLILDLKTTKAVPRPRSEGGKPSPAHVRQAALYSEARQAPAALFYVSHARNNLFHLDKEETEAALNDMHADAVSLFKFLSRVDNAKDALSCLPIDRDHYRCPKKLNVSLDQLLMAG